MSWTRSIRVGLFVVPFLAGAVEAHSQEVHFVAREFQANRPVWHTETMLLERSIGDEEDLVFVLTNPTSAEHAFVIPGVQRVTKERILTPESSPDIPWPMTLVYAEPLSVTVKPGETKRVKIHAAALLAPKSAGQAFRYYCEIHKDVHLAGSLFVL